MVVTCPIDLVNAKKSDPVLAKLTFLTLNPCSNTDREHKIRFFSQKAY